MPEARAGGDHQHGAWFETSAEIHVFAVGYAGKPIEPVIESHVTHHIAAKAHQRAGEFPHWNRSRVATLACVPIYRLPFVTEWAEHKQRVPQPEDARRPRIVGD